MSKLMIEASKRKVNDITESHFEILFKSPFKLIRNTMKEGKFESVRLLYFGTFTVDVFRKKQYDKFIRNNNNESNNTN